MAVAITMTSHTAMDDGRIRVALTDGAEQFTQIVVPAEGGFQSYEYGTAISDIRLGATVYATMEAAAVAGAESFAQRHTASARRMFAAYGAAVAEREDMDGPSGYGW